MALVMSASLKSSNEASPSGEKRGALRRCSARWCCASRESEGGKEVWRRGWPVGVEVEMKEDLRLEFADGRARVGR